MPRKNKTPKVSSNPYRGAGGKTPKAAHNVPAEKKPTVSVDFPEELDERHLEFTFRDADMVGPWSLQNISEIDARTLFSFLKDMESMTMKEAMAGETGKMADYEDMTGCPNPAPAQRLAELYDGADNVCRLRVTGRKRLIGLRVEHRFSVLWWDPEHEIWPTQKRHT